MDAPYRGRYLAGVLLFVAGAALALRFPDLDLKLTFPPLMVHRSLLMHGALAAVLLYGMALRASGPEPEGPTYTHPNARPGPRLFAMGVCLGYATHLVFDIFPHAWRGYALVYAPFWGRLSILGSQLWLAASALLCLHLAFRLMRRSHEVLMAVACLGACYGTSAALEGHAAIGALLTLPSLAALASRMKFSLPK